MKESHELKAGVSVPNWERVSARNGTQMLQIPAESAQSASRCRYLGNDDSSKMVSLVVHRFIVETVAHDRLPGSGCGGSWWIDYRRHIAIGTVLPSSCCHLSPGCQARPPREQENLKSPHLFWEIVAVLWNKS
ncbi:hypothetical protein J6590_032571 [Homalodisca vitripennis]|nr:hypothetical protein J6590_032571 [Homalodisca vitripennis]